MKFKVEWVEVYAWYDIGKNETIPQTRQRNPIIVEAQSLEEAEAAAKDKLREMFSGKHVKTSYGTIKPFEIRGILSVV